MASHDPNRPNILFILSDDQGAWALGRNGNTEIQTPNLDRLAATGLYLDNYFCTTPVCSPARANILTGTVPSQHGIHDFIRIRQGRNPVYNAGNGKAIEYLQGQKTYTDLLSENGYICGLAGKWHLGDECRPQKGFSFWRVSAVGNGPYRRTPVVTENDPTPSWTDQYFTHWITERAIEFLGAQLSSSAPFYLSCHYTAPHSPWARNQHPEDTYDRYFDCCPFMSVPDSPLNPNQMQRPWLRQNAENRRELLSGYYAAVEEMDAGIGELVDWLEKNGLRENTLVFFTSDNGMNMGHHGIYGKGNGTFPLNMYDTSVKVPAIVSRPGHIPENQTRQELLSHYDIFPTILDVVGIDAEDDIKRPGRSFAPLLSGKQLPGPERVVVYHEYGLVRMVRTREWKYVHRHPFGPNELYDLRTDPDESTNLIENEKHRDRAGKMKGWIDKWFAEYSDPRRIGLAHPVAGTGQINLVPPPSPDERVFEPPPKTMGTEV